MIDKQMIEDISLSVIIPAFNEQETINEVVNSIFNSLQGKLIFEVIVVNDGSTDDTVLRMDSSKAVVLNHKSRKGYGAALKSGIHKAKYDYICTIDADGQHNPFDILTLVECLQENDLVIGKRSGLKTTILRFPGKFLITTLCAVLMRKKILDLNSGFRIFHKNKIIPYLGMCSDGFSFSTTSTIVFLSDGREVHYEPIALNYRTDGKSRVNIYTGFRTLLLVLQIITVFYPLRVFLPISFSFGFVGFIKLISDLSQSNITDSTLLILISSLIFFVFALISDQLSNLRKELVGLKGKFL